METVDKLVLACCKLKERWRLKSVYRTVLGSFKRILLEEPQASFFEDEPVSMLDKDAYGNGEQPYDRCSEADLDERPELVTIAIQVLSMRKATQPALLRFLTIVRVHASWGCLCRRLTQRL